MRAGPLESLGVLQLLSVEIINGCTQWACCNSVVRAGIGDG